MTADAEQPRVVLSLDDLHVWAQRAESEMESGQYRHAVRRAAEEFSIRVASLSGLNEMSGRSLMERAFQRGDPVLPLRPRPGTRSPRSERNELDGLREFSTGLMAAVRNVFTHETEPQISRAEAMEWLGFISALHRILDRAEASGAAVSGDPDR